MIMTSTEEKIAEAQATIPDEVREWASSVDFRIGAYDAKDNERALMLEKVLQHALKNPDTLSKYGRKRFVRAYFDAKEDFLKAVMEGLMLNMDDYKPYIVSPILPEKAPKNDN